jgi:hypothetical protein
MEQSVVTKPDATAPYASQPVVNTVDDGLHHIPVTISVTGPGISGSSVKSNKQPGVLTVDTTNMQLRLTLTTSETKSSRSEHSQTSV